MSLMIGFCGAASTGKTTVANLLVNEPDFDEEFQPSIVRETMEAHGVTEQTSLDFSPQEMHELQLNIIRSKLTQDSIGRGLFDRTPVDQFAYLMLRCYNELIDYHKWWGLILQAIQKYDLVFYFPAYNEIPYEKDGFRAVSPAWRDLQATVMKSLLCSMYPLHYELPLESPEDRVQRIMRAVRLKGLVKNKRQNRKRS